MTDTVTLNAATLVAAIINPDEQKVIDGLNARLVSFNVAMAPTVIVVEEDKPKRRGGKRRGAKRGRKTKTVRVPKARKAKAKRKYVRRAKKVADVAPVEKKARKVKAKRKYARRVKKADAAPAAPAADAAPVVAPRGRPAVAPSGAPGEG